MKANIPRARPGRQGGGQEPAPKSIIFPIIVLALLLAGGAAGYIALKKLAPPPSQPQPVVSSEAPGPPSLPVPIRRNTPSAIQSPASIPPAPADDRSPKELVASLTRIDGKNPLMPDQAQAWKQALQQLIKQGPAAVPDIQQFLAQNQDTNYASLSGAGQLGFPSLRAGLIDALGQIGGTEATAAMLQILQSSTIPSDVGELAKAMGQPATGQYQQEFLAAVRMQLFLAQEPQSIQDTDVGPLFQVLAAEAANGAQVTQDIQQYGSAWSFYSAITLANLPDGAGLPALMQMAQTPGGGQVVAVDCLAQMALANPQALAVLLNMAQSGSATDFMLATVVPFLAGRQFVLPSSADPIPPGAQIQTVHMNAGNQNFLSFEASNPTLVNQQMDVINQLLQAIPAADNDTLQALQQQKNRLSSKSGK